MNSDGEENFENLYEESDAPRHDKLVDKLLRLNKSQQLKKPSRTEPALKVSEFDLVKSLTGEKGTVDLEDLTSTLKSRKSRVRINEKLKRVSKATKTLPKPLEKPQADRIRRGVAYERARLELDRYESVVTSNRAANHLTFPLQNDFKLEQAEAANFTNRWRVKSDFEKELEQIESQVETVNVEIPKKDEFPLNMKEMMIRRKEAAKLRAFQGYQEAKARRENKIKSKRYHRIKKKEKIKKKLKEFEELQKTDPEGALKKLEEIEKARIEERFSLRHKSTGQWARSKQVRAKYDKESRQVLAKQLSISKELTQKSKTANDSEEDEEVEVKEPINNTDEDNPWINNSIKPGKEVANFLSGYRKFWAEKNREIVEQNTEKEQPVEIEDLPEEEFPEEPPKKMEKVTTPPKPKKKASRPKQAIKIKKKDNKLKKLKKSLTVKPKGTTNWSVSVLNEKGNLISIDGLFDKLQTQLKKKSLKNVELLKKKLSRNEEKKKPQKLTKPKVDLSFPQRRTRAIIDEELIETTQRTEEDLNDQSDNLKTLKNVILSENVENNKQKPQNIDPNKYVKVKTTKLKTAIPDILTTENDLDDDDSIDKNQRDLICEAFEDDDIIQNFNREKNDEINSDKPKDINLTLPGWGSWGGTNIAISRRKKRRFTLKAPPTVPRRDDNKGNLIINEKAQRKIKEHMVTEIPFPFKSVKDFEASVRAPIGSTFVPEMAFKRLVRPAVTTKMGNIIEPMSKDILLNKKDTTF